MKNALILFRDFNSDFDSDNLTLIVDMFRNSGYPFSSIDILPIDDELTFTNVVNNSKKTADNLLIVCGNQTFDIKGVLSDVFSLEYEENANARRFVDAVNLAKDTNYDGEYAVIPKGAIHIPNIEGPFQGYIVEDSGFSLALLPCQMKGLTLMAEKYFIRHLEEKSGVKKRRITLKYFGDRNKLQTVLIKAEELSKGLCYYITEKNGDMKVDLIFSSSVNSESSDAVRYIVSTLKDNIYAEYDVSLQERLFDLLKLKNLKISVAESFTGGRLVSSLISNSGASSVLMEGIVSYSNDSKIDRLGVDKGSLIKEGAVSSIVAYQMAMGLLRKGVDIALSTTGIAGPKSDNTNKPVGLCYIGVGMKNGIHTYKLNLKGDREGITETAKNTALFLAIKNIKNI